MSVRGRIAHQSFLHRRWNFSSCISPRICGASGVAHFDVSIGQRKSKRVVFEALFTAGRLHPLKEPPECLKITLLSN